MCNEKMSLAERAGTELEARLSLGLSGMMSGKGPRHCPPALPPCTYLGETHPLSWEAC